jgi:hypothetical protein
MLGLATSFAELWWATRDSKVGMGGSDDAAAPDERAACKAPTGVTAACDVSELQKCLDEHKGDATQVSWTAGKQCTIAVHHLHTGCLKELAHAVVQLLAVPTPGSSLPAGVCSAASSHHTAQLHPLINQLPSLWPVPRKAAEASDGCCCCPGVCAPPAPKAPLNIAPNPLPCCCCCCPDDPAGPLDVPA